MASKLITYDADAKASLKKGVDTIANAVKVTLGPKGRNVIMERKFGPPTVTKDGVTVAREMELKDPVENMGAQMVKEAAQKTNDVAGDGTTTATVLTQAMYREGLKYVTSGANPMDLKRGMDKAVEKVVEQLKKISKKVDTNEEIAHVASISANNDAEIGKLIANAMKEVGNDGVVTVQESKSMETTVEIVKGMQFDRGYLSPFFVTNSESMKAEYDDPYILIYDGRISTMREVLPVLEKTKAANRPLLIIAEQIDEEALSTLVVNKIRGTISVCAVTAPGFGDRRKDILEDIAIVTKGTVISKVQGLTLDKVTLAHLGQSKKLAVGKDETVIIQGVGELVDVEKRLADLKTQMDKIESDYDKEKLGERIGKLSGGVGIIKVGAATDVEVRQKNARVEDALHATKAAIEEGIVPGGGIALIRAGVVLEGNTDEIQDIVLGMGIIKKALEEPLRQIVKNAGLSPDVVVDNVKKQTADSMGFNAQTESYEDLMVTGVIDSTKVVRVALENASSVASMLLMTEATMTDIPEDTPHKPGDAMGNFEY